MSVKQNVVEVFQTNRFRKSCDKLSENELCIVENEIDKIIENPLIGELKKGDLSHLRVHKFKLNTQLVLLGYSWIAGKLELYLLGIGSHENFYSNQKKQSKSDLKFIML
ncbi:type II toxin-antitoxin system RelE/ParE family toxin [Providencia rustigianii]|uniref:type II toxin-antitoxin system RelE/ParE family toxin n=1 Tax=Providencia rustigianii TaxID=158850 RepID=UPI000F6C5D2D|nr:type II toxin-antitoxin system RelE/ParE family toxin [Providencia rustigianii]MTC59894.1 type II toxin-antitoxin system RelE/ParE family toxin [Providencia rustigianii]VEH52706.1 Uncharacterised protein [Providencia rustigianii]